MLFYRSSDEAHTFIADSIRAYFCVDCYLHDFFGKGETTWWEWGLIHITEESFYRGLHLGFRALIFALLGLMFSLTTRPVFLFYSLMQQLKLKPKYAYSFMAGIRLIPIMIEEFQTIRQAMIVRGVEQRKGLANFFIN